jgi:hypothetical protein
LGPTLSLPILAPFVCDNRIHDLTRNHCQMTHEQDLESQLALATAYVKGRKALAIYTNDSISKTLLSREATVPFKHLRRSNFKSTVVPTQIVATTNQPAPIAGSVKRRHSGQHN